MSSNIVDFSDYARHREFPPASPFFVQGVVEFKPPRSVEDQHWHTAYLFIEELMRSNGHRTSALHQRYKAFVRAEKRFVSVHGISVDPWLIHYATVETPKEAEEQVMALVEEVKDVKRLPKPVLYGELYRRAI